MKEKVVAAMEHYFGRDQKRINHAHRVLRHAENLLAKTDADQEIVVAAAVLHDIGIHAAERKYGSTAGKYQEIEGPPIAENILRKIDFPENKLGEVLQIIAHHHRPGIIKTVNYNIIYEADGLVNKENNDNAAD